MLLGRRDFARVALAVSTQGVDVLSLRPLGGVLGHLDAVEKHSFGALVFAMFLTMGASSCHSSCE